MLIICIPLDGEPPHFLSYNSCQPCDHVSKFSIPIPSPPSSLLSPVCPLLGIGVTEGVEDLVTLLDVVGGHLQAHRGLERGPATPTLLRHLVVGLVATVLGGG